MNKKAISKVDFKEADVNNQNEWLKYEEAMNKGLFLQFYFFYLYDEALSTMTILHREQIKLLELKLVERVFFLPVPVVKKPVVVNFKEVKGE